MSSWVSLVVCVKKDEPKLQFLKVYQQNLGDKNENTRKILDDSGEYHLYPRKWFLPISASQRLKQFMEGAAVGADIQGFLKVVKECDIEFETDKEGICELLECYPDEVEEAKNLFYRVREKYPKSKLKLTFHDYDYCDTLFLKVPYKDCTLEDLEQIVNESMIVLTGCYSL